MTEEEISKMARCPACRQPERALLAIQDLVDAQARDAGLWMLGQDVLRDDGQMIVVPISEGEAYLQQGLRDLHFLIEELTQ